jgi:acetyl esterase
MSSFESSGPEGVTGPLPVIVYIHGAGWVFGDFHTHERLVRELAAGVGAAVVFPEYSRSPEARYPIAIEENYAAAKWVAEHGAERGLDTGLRSSAIRSAGP